MVAIKLRLSIFFIACFIEIINTTFMEASLRHFEPLVKNADKHVNFDKLRVRKINRTHHLFLGDLETFEVFGDDYTVEGLIYKMAGNDYKLLPYHLGPHGWCEFVEKNKWLYEKFRDVSDFPEVENVSFLKEICTKYNFIILTKNSSVHGQR